MKVTHSKKNVTRNVVDGNKDHLNYDCVEIGENVQPSPNIYV